MKVLKTTICCILALAISVSALTGCRKNDVPASESAPESRPEEPPSVSSDAESAESKDVSAAESEESAYADVSDAESEEIGAIISDAPGRKYVWEKEGFGGDFTIYLKEDGTYSYYEGNLSSYFGFGTWTEEYGTVTLHKTGSCIRFLLTPYALVYIAEGSERFVFSDVKDGDLFYLSGNTRWDRARYVPDYKSTSTLRADEFLEKLKAHGYHVGDTVETGFHSENIESVFNITPAGISEENADLEFFCVYPAGFCFFMYKGEIYRYDTFGGYHHFLALWDYDGNGVKDIVSYDTFGSGIPHLGVFVKDLTTMESINVYTRNILSEPGFSFDFDGKNIYIDGEKLTYSDGKFHCGDLLE